MLSDEVIYLRKLEKSDLNQTWLWLHQHDIYSKIGVHVPFSHSDQDRWFETLEKSNDKMVFAVCLLEGDQHIGNVSLDNVDLRHRNARVSIFIGNKEKRGGHLGSRALEILGSYAFEFLNLNKIWCKTTNGDDVVLAFYEKLGWKQEGVLREHEYHDGQYLDKAIFGLTKAHYEGRRS